MKSLFEHSAAIPPEALARLSVAADGSVGLGDGLGYRFRYLGITFQAEIRSAQARSQLHLTAYVCDLPFTAEAPGARRAVAEIVEASENLPEIRFAADARRRIFCLGQAPLGAVSSPAEVIVATTALLLAIKPYLLILLDVLPPREPIAG